MLSIFPRALISSVLLMLLSSPAGAYDKQSAMDAAKEEVDQRHPHRELSFRHGSGIRIGRI